MTSFSKLAFFGALALSATLAAVVQKRHASEALPADGERLAPPAQVVTTVCYPTGNPEDPPAFLVTTRRAPDELLEIWARRHARIVGERPRSQVLARGFEAELPPPGSACVARDWKSGGELHHQLLTHAEGLAAGDLSAASEAALLQLQAALDSSPWVPETPPAARE